MRRLSQPVTCSSALVRRSVKLDRKSGRQRYSTDTASNEFSSSLSGISSLLSLESLMASRLASRLASASLEASSTAWTAVLVSLASLTSLRVS